MVGKSKEIRIIRTGSISLWLLYLIYLHSLVCDYTLYYYFPCQTYRACKRNGETEKERHREREREKSCCYRWWFQSFIGLNSYLSSVFFSFASSSSRFSLVIVRRCRCVCAHITFTVSYALVHLRAHHKFSNMYQIYTFIFPFSYLFILR